MVRLRIWLSALVLALPPAAIAISWAVLAPRLPETIAIHWSGTDVADGFSPTVPTAVTLLAITTGMLLVGLVLAAVRIGERARATILSLLAAVSGMLAAGWIVSAITTVEAGTAERAVLGPWLLLLLGSVALLLVPWFLHPRGELQAPRPVRPIELAPTDAAQWQGGASSAMFLWVGGGLALAGVLLAILLAPAGAGGATLFSGIVLLAVGLLVVSLARIRVTVDDEGLRVRSGVIGVPLRTIATERIRVVEAMLVEPAEWGGWGYRGLPGQSAIVLGRGEGIVVTTRNGSRFAVTVDDAQTGASTLAAVVERQRDLEEPPSRPRPGGE